MPIENVRPLLQGPRYSDDSLSWWDGSRWRSLSEGPPLSSDGHFWWNGTDWQPKHHGKAPRSGGGIVNTLVTVLGVGAMIWVASALGLVNIQHHNVEGGWTVSAAGYSCWLAPAENWGKSYCGKEPLPKPAN